MSKKEQYTFKLKNGKYADGMVTPKMWAIKQQNPVNTTNFDSIIKDPRPSE